MSRFSTFFNKNPIKKQARTRSATETARRDRFGEEFGSILASILGLRGSRNLPKPLPKEVRTQFGMTFDFRCEKGQTSLPCQTQVRPPSRNAQPRWLVVLELAICGWMLPPLSNTPRTPGKQGAAESLRAFRLAESIRRSEVYACMYVRMSCDVMLFFEWFYVSKAIQNRSQIGPKSLPNPPQIGPKSCPKRSAATNGRPKRSKVKNPNVAQRFLLDFGGFGGPFWEQKHVKNAFLRGLRSKSFAKSFFFITCEIDFGWFWDLFGDVFF